MKFLAINRYNLVDVFCLGIAADVIRDVGLIGLLLVIPWVGLSYAVEKAAGFPNN